jgi:hypothetical protein
MDERNEVVSEGFSAAVVWNLALDDDKVKFGDVLFSGSRFIFWVLAPFILLFAAITPFFRKQLEHYLDCNRFRP